MLLSASGQHLSWSFKPSQGQIPLQGPTSSVGIYIDSGSIHEDPQITGASNLMEYMAFKATPNRSSFRVMREVKPHLPQRK